MSITWDDVAWELAHAEEAWQEVVDNISSEALDKFFEDRYKVYFKNNPQMHLPVLSIISEAKNLFTNRHLAASLVFSFTAVENILRELILRPLVWGTFIDDEVASIITNKLLSDRLDQLSKLIFSFLNKNIGIDIQTAKRSNISTPLWQEIRELKELRNRVVHSGEQCDDKSAMRALSIAEYLYKEIFQAILKAASLEIDSSNRIAHNEK